MIEVMSTKGFVRGLFQNLFCLIMAMKGLGRGILKFMFIDILNDSWVLELPSGAEAVLTELFTNVRLLIMEGPHTLSLSE